MPVNRKGARLSAIGHFAVIALILATDGCDLKPQEKTAQGAAARPRGARNLNATGFAGKILDAIPNPIVILEVVLRELQAGRAKGWPECASTKRILRG
jgi:hypothetical protein